MYLYHVLFTLINICGIDCQKKEMNRFKDKKLDQPLELPTRSPSSPRPTAASMPGSSPSSSLFSRSCQPGPPQPRRRHHRHRAMPPPSPQIGLFSCWMFCQARLTWISFRYTFYNYGLVSTPLKHHHC
jgi:hypothetical protein